MVVVVIVASSRSTIVSAGLVVVPVTPAVVVSLDIPASAPAPAPVAIAPAPLGGRVLRRRIVRVLVLVLAAVPAVASFSFSVPVTSLPLAFLVAFALERPVLLAPALFVISTSGSGCPPPARRGRLRRDRAVHAPVSVLRAPERETMRTHAARSEREDEGASLPFCTESREH